MAPPTGQKRKALGKGIDLLFASPPGAKPAASSDDKKGILNVAIEDIHPNKSQPRKTFDPDSLEELAATIREHGLMQPIVVRKRTHGYEIVAGERRWRASQKAGLKTVDIIVKELSDADAFTMALVENIQREDLNPIELAMAFKQLLDERKLTQDQLAEVLHKDRSTIANSLRLLKLPADVRRQVVSGALSMGHARALLALEDEDQMVKAAREVLRRGLSVRQVEKLVKTTRGKGEGAAASDEPDPFAGLPGGTEAVKRETELLTRRFATKVRFTMTGPKRGRVEIDYSSPEELDRLLTLLKG